VGTIVNDDPLVRAEIHDTTVYESHGRIYIRASLSAPSGQVVRVRYSTQNGTASSPSDYAGISNIILTFAPGETTQYASVIVKLDNLNEPTEYFNVRLVSAENATLSNNTRTARVTLLNGTDNSLTKGKPQEVQHELAQLQAEAWPNPATTGFNLKVMSSLQEEITVIIRDLSGREIWRTERVLPNTIIKVGDSWRSGVYIAEIIQGEQRKTLRLIRQN
jgi:hypothetical protein